MARIRFLSDQIYECEGPGKGPAFAKGAVLDEGGVSAALGRDVSREQAEAFLNRWVQRGVAEEVDHRTPTLDEIEEDRQAQEAKADAIDASDDEVAPTFQDVAPSADQSPVAKRGRPSRRNSF